MSFTRDRTVMHQRHQARQRNDAAQTGQYNSQRLHKILHSLESRPCRHGGQHPTAVALSKCNRYLERCNLRYRSAVRQDYSHNFGDLKIVAAYLSRINLYPVKSLDGQTVKEARLLAIGALEHDRQFAIFDTEGVVVDGKRTAAAHLLHSQFDPSGRWLVLRRRPDGEAARFHIDRERQKLEWWLGEHFGLPVRVAENSTGGFPDDTVAAGPTVISEATMEAVAGWFPGVSVDEVRARFRPSLEIAGVAAFFEDQLYAGTDEVVEFALGPAVLAGMYPCQRCVVPTRWSLTGEVGPDPAFAKTFSQRREETLPSWADRSRFDHFFRLAVNTRLAAGAGTVLTIGDELRILGHRSS